MPTVTFSSLNVHQTYSRPVLANLWGYAGYQALARGVVTPADHPYIILFVTAEKQTFQEQYRDRLQGDLLYWEGPTDHFAEGRMVAAAGGLDEIHVFYRPRHHEDFEYLGRAEIQETTIKRDAPSAFVLRLLEI